MLEDNRKILLIMATQLSLFRQLFPCASAVCKSGGDVSVKVTTTFYPHGKNNTRAWTHTELLCQSCADRLRKSMQENPMITEYNDIKIETV